MSNTGEHHSHFKQYMMVFVVLTFLTVIELFIPGMNATQMTKGLLLVILAVAKAVVVAYYYMHLNEETNWLRFIAAIPISAAIFAAVVILESMYR